MRAELRQSMVIELNESQARMLKEMMRNPVDGGRPQDEDQEIRALRRELFDSIESVFPTTITRSMDR